MNTNELKILDELARAEKYFSHSKYKDIVEKASIYWEVGDFQKVEEMLKQLPDRRQLLRELVGKLKGKPVYKTLKRIEKGDMKDSDQSLKGLFSLGTHAIIESEKGNKEYRMLLHSIHERIGQILYRGD